MGPHKDIVGAGADPDLVAVLAAVHHTLAQVGALLLFDLGDLAHHNLVDAGGQVDQLLHLKATGEQLFFQFLRRHVDVDEFF